MKILLRISLVLISLMAIIVGIILCARAGYLDKPLKKLIVYYLSKEHIPASLDDFHINHKGITISHLSYPIDDHTKVELSNLMLKLGRGLSLKKPVIETDISADVFLSNDHNQTFIKSDISGQFYHKFLTKKTKLKLDFLNLKSNAISNQDELSVGKAYCLYVSNSTNIENIDCNLDYDEKTLLSLTSEIKRKNGKYKNIQANLKVADIPLAILQFVEKFSGNNEALKHLNNMIQSGIINHGELQIALDKDFFKHKTILPANIEGKFTFSNLAVKYLNDFPIVEKAQGEIVLHGHDINLKVKEAYSNNILLINGDLKLDGLTSDDIKLIINADAKSPASELSAFVPQDSLKKLEQSGIDLKKLVGTADTKINIIIPFKESEKNSYDITSDIKNGTWQIFDGNVELSKANISGKFDGEKLILDGTTYINNFNSEINYQLNLEKAQEFEQLLKIRTKILNQYEKSGPVQMISGKAIINFEYKVKNDITTIKADSDLKNLNFKVETLGIHKDYGQKANFTLQSTLSNKKDAPISFNLTGEDNLKIVGNIFLEKDQKRISIPTFTYKRTNVNSEITSSKDEFKVRVRGDCIDLSNANLMSFLEKGKESESDAISNIKFNVNKIKLKNDIWLSNVAMAVKCNRHRCIKGYLNSNVGSKFFKMLMKAYEDKEEWTITSNNAGAVFRAFDIYKNLRAGTMILTLNTSRQEVKKGEIVPILDGRFIFRKFVVTDTPILTRMVSFISLPGLFNTITNNKNIAFYEIKGKFDYSKDTINILKGSAEGPFFDFNITGSVNTAKHHINLDGYVIPSMYGLTAIIKKIPLIGKAIVGGKHRGFFTAPFSIDQGY